MNESALPESWTILRDWLPADLDASARAHGFFRRARGLQDAECWLRLILMHVAGGLSLEQTVVRARELGLAAVTAVALFKRLRGAHDWLFELTRHLLREQQRFLHQAALPGPARLRVVDATDIQEPGATGKAWRLHYSLQLPELSCDYFELTDIKGGEKLGRFGFAPGEWVLADRGYSHRAGAASVLRAGAEFIVRWNPPVFPLENEAEEPFLPLEPLRRLAEGEVRQWPAFFLWAGQRHRVWLCALRKSALAAERAQRKTREKARRNRSRQPDPQSLELAQYVLVVTSVAPAICTATAVLELYRCRWQIELAFKRLKSLLGLGHVPKKHEASAKSWMQAKVLTALLIERVLWEAKIFSPWGYQLRREPLAGLSRSQ
jgi:hypothetical protein